MGVMAAGVRHARHLRSERQAGSLSHRQRVDIGAQRDTRGVLGSEVAYQPRASGQGLGVESGINEAVGDELGGGKFLAPQLRVAVDMAAPGDKIVVVRSQPRLSDVGQRHRESIAPVACGPVRLPG